MLLTLSQKQDQPKHVQNNLRGNNVSKKSVIEFNFTQVEMRSPVKNSWSVRNVLFLIGMVRDVM